MQFKKNKLNPTLHQNVQKMVLYHTFLQPLLLEKYCVSSYFFLRACNCLPGDRCEGAGPMGRSRRVLVELERRTRGDDGVEESPPILEPRDGGTPWGISRATMLLITLHMGTVQYSSLTDRSPSAERKEKSLV